MSSLTKLCMYNYGRHKAGAAETMLYIHLFSRLHDPLSSIADLCLREAKPAHVFLRNIHCLLHLIHLNMGTGIKAD